MTKEQGAITKLLEGKGDRADLILVGNALDRLAQYEEVLCNGRLTEPYTTLTKEVDYGYAKKELSYKTELTVKLYDKLRSLEDIYEKEKK